MRVGFAEVEGARTRYLHEGAGEALILLHGVGISGDCFIRNFGSLGRKFSLYAPDLPGHGFSDALDYRDEAPPVVMARHICAFARAMKLDLYYVGGSSYGALVAALMYFEDRERVKGLILIGSGSVFHPNDDQKKTLRAAAANAKQAMSAPTWESCRQRMANIVYDPASVPDEILPIQLTSYALPDRAAAYEATIRGTIETMDAPNSRVYDRLEKIDVPTLVVTGRNDVRADCARHEAGVARMPAARLHVYEKCGHLPFMEYPARFNADVVDFIASAAKPRG